jgi:NDP-sugar pyrophosphorylase family protein
VTGLPSTLVLAAGLGTRLQPLTYVRAKAAVPVAGVPLVSRILAQLARQGVADCVINLHHLPASITGIVGDGAQHGVRVRYSWEHTVLGSGGGPRYALPLLETDPFLLVNGDTLTDLELAPLVAAHEAWDASVTMAVIPNRHWDRYGGVLVDREGRVEGFTRRGDPRPSFHFVGLQVVRAEVFAALPDGVFAESIGGVYRDVARRRPGAVRAWVADGAFYDIGSVADYLETVLELAEPGREDALGGARLRIAPTASISRTILWDDVSVGEDCVLHECVIADGVHVPAGSELTRCAIVPVASGPPLPGAERRGDLLVARFEPRPAAVATRGTP